MFPASHRLKSLAVFRRLHQFRAVFRHAGFMMLAVPVPDYPDKPEVTERLLSAPVQFGVVISKKVHKSAVVRNRIRRRWREVIRRDVLPLLPTEGAVTVKKRKKPCRAFIYIVRQQAVSMNFEVFRQAICQSALEVFEKVDVKSTEGLQT